nr:4-alpha-glucanotransferase [Rhizobium sp. FKY42]
MESAGFNAPDPQKLKHDPEELDRFIIDLHTLLAQSRSLLFSVRLADLTKEPQPTNIPGTSTSHPNWRTRLSVTLENMDELPLVQDVTDTLRRVRPKSY